MKPWLSGLRVVFQCHNEIKKPILLKSQLSLSKLSSHENYRDRKSKQILDTANVLTDTQREDHRLMVVAMPIFNLALCFSYAFAPTT